MVSFRAHSTKLRAGEMSREISIKSFRDFSALDWNIEESK